MLRVYVSTCAGYMYTTWLQMRLKIKWITMLAYNTSSFLITTQSDRTDGPDPQGPLKQQGTWWGGFQTHLGPLGPTEHRGTLRKVTFVLSLVPDCSPADKKYKLQLQDQRGPYMKHAMSRNTHWKHAVDGISLRPGPEESSHQSLSTPLFYLHATAGHISHELNEAQRGISQASPSPELH